VAALELWGSLRYKHDGHNYLARYLLCVQSRFLDWANVAYERWTVRGWRPFERGSLMSSWPGIREANHCLLALFGQSAVSTHRACKFLHSALVGSCWILIYANEIYAIQSATCPVSGLKYPLKRKTETEIGTPAALRSLGE